MTNAARFWLFCIALMGWGVSAAQTITIGELQRLLQSVPAGDMRFQEQRQSPWLAAPVESRGVVRSLPQGLEKTDRITQTGDLAYAA